MTRTVIPQTPALVLATYRAEYEGALARVHGAQTIALAPLSDSETAALGLAAARAGALGWRAGIRTPVVGAVAVVMPQVCLKSLTRTKY